MKICTLCKLEKSLEDCYYKWNKATCKKCITARGTEARRQWRKDNPEICREYSKKWREQNPDKAKKVAAKGRIKNKESRNKLKKEWYDNNRDKERSYTAKRRATSKNARIINTGECDKEIQNIYKKAKLLEEINKIPYNVDHIIPLTHKNVCGLDVPWNLRVIPKDMNASKKNKFDGTYENSSWKFDYLEKEKLKE